MPENRLNTTIFEHKKIDATGFEPATSASRTQRSTKLSHASIRASHLLCVAT